jgi:hypothetical protein
MMPCDPMEHLDARLRPLLADIEALCGYPTAKAVEEVFLDLTYLYEEARLRRPKCQVWESHGRGG